MSSRMCRSRRREEHRMGLIQWLIFVVCMLVTIAPMLVFVRFAYEWMALVYDVVPSPWAEVIRGLVPPLVGGVPAIGLSCWLRHLTRRRSIGVRVHGP